MPVVNDEHSVSIIQNMSKTEKNFSNNINLSKTDNEKQSNEKMEIE